MNISKKNKSKLIYTLLLTLIIFMSLFLAWKSGFETAPDEGMKYELIEYIATHNKLPHGGDSEIINKMWGTSYAFTPYLSYIVSAIFVKIFMIFTTNLKLLTFAARIPSIIFYILYFHFTWSISKKLFKDNSKYLFTVLCTFLPSIAYLGTYINTDMFALFTSSFIFYQWLNGIENKWDYKTCILLGIGIGLCFLSHYYYYGYIVCSFLIYVFSNILKKINFKTFIKKGMIVFAFTFLISGWWFIRQYKLYDGDIFALNISTEYAEKYADENHKPTVLAKNAQDLFDLILWLDKSVNTYYGEFRYNDIHYKPIIYFLFFEFVFIGIILYIIKIFSKKQNKDEIIFDFIKIITIIIPFILSAYYSANSDYQPQGRYLLSSCIPLMLFITYGYQYIFKDKEKLKNIFIKIIIIIFLIMPIYTYFGYLKGNVEVKIAERIM